MKFKITPLLLLPIVLLLYGAYRGLFESGGEGWGTLFLLAFIGLGLLSLILYAISRAIFKTKVRTQIIVEVLLIGGLLFYIYKRSGEKIFILPSNYDSYVIMVYGVRNQKHLNKNFLTNKIRIRVPTNGIILTSSRFNENYPRASFIDERLGQIDKIFADSIRRYEIPEGNDTLMVGKTTYDIEVWFIKWEKNYKMLNIDKDNDDSIKAAIRFILDK